MKNTEGIMSSSGRGGPWENNGNIVTRCFLIM